MQSPKTPGNGCSSSSLRPSLTQRVTRFTPPATNRGPIRLRHRSHRFESQSLCLRENALSPVNRSAVLPDVCRICDKQLAPNSELISFCDCLRRGVVYAMMKKTPSVSEAPWLEKPLISCQWSRAIPVAGTVLHGRDDVDASPASCVPRVSLRCVTVILFLA